MGIFGTWSIRRKLLAVVSLLILLAVTAVASVSYMRYGQDLTDLTTRQARQLIGQIALNVDNYLDDLLRLCKTPYYNHALMGWLQKDAGTEWEMLQKQRAIEEFLSEVMTVPRSDILRAHIVTDQVYSSSKTRYPADIGSDYTDKEWYKAALASSSPVFIPVVQEREGTSSQISVFYVAQQLRSLADTGRVLGVIRVDANYQGIRTVCDKAGVTDGILMILDGSGAVLYQNEGAEESDTRALATYSSGNDTQAHIVRLGSRDYSVQSLALASGGWRIVYAQSVQALTVPAAKARNAAVLAALVCATAGVLVSVVLIRRFLRPISHLNAIIKQVEAGDLSVRTGMAGGDEVQRLGQSFDGMLNQIESMRRHDVQLTRQVYEARYLQKDAQYTSLYHQIRPHFLFNTLSTISILIKSGRNNEAADSVGRLAALLRGMVNADRDITIEQEFALAESYLVLQKARFASFTYEIVLPESLKGYLMPAMTVQPLVENALRHGFSMPREGAHIRAEAVDEGNSIRIRVTDNGAGMSQGQLAVLHAALETKDEIQSPGAGDAHRSVGLVNIARRLHLRYGEGCGLEIVSTSGEGTQVTLCIPYTKEDGNVSGIDR